MKLLAGIAVSISLLIGSEEITRPEVIFKTGAEFRFSGDVDAKREKKQKYVSSFTVNDVIQDGQHWFCNSTMTYLIDGMSEVQNYLFQFACDSLNYYVISANFAFRKTEDILKGNDFSTGDSLVYPLQMKVGDTLPAAWYRMVTSNQDGSSHATADFTNRVVKEVDTLNLSFGKTPAFRITATKTIRVSGSSKYAGKYDRTLEVEFTEWFSPRLGVVRAEERTPESVSKMVLESYSGN